MVLTSEEWGISLDVPSSEILSLTTVEESSVVTILCRNSNEAIQLIYVETTQECSTLVDPPYTVECSDLYVDEGELSELTNLTESTLPECVCTLRESATILDSETTAVSVQSTEVLPLQSTEVDTKIIQVSSTEIDKLAPVETKAFEIDHSTDETITLTPIEGTQHSDTVKQLFAPEIVYVVTKETHGLNIALRQDTTVTLYRSLETSDANYLFPPPVTYPVVDYTLEVRKRVGDRFDLLGVLENRIAPSIQRELGLADVLTFNMQLSDPKYQLLAGAPRDIEIWYYGRDAKLKQVFVIQKIEPYRDYGGSGGGSGGSTLGSGSGDNMLIVADGPESYLTMYMVNADYKVTQRHTVDILGDICWEAKDDGVISDVYVDHALNMPLDIDLSWENLKTACDNIIAQTGGYLLMYVDPDDPTKRALVLTSLGTEYSSLERTIYPFYTVSADPYQYESWPSLAKLADGTLVATYRLADTNEHLYEASGRVVCKRSKDAGKTWSNDIIIHDPDGEIEASSGAIICFMDGSIETLLAVTQTRNANYDYGTSAVKSIDGGLTWGSPTVLRATTVHGNTATRTCLEANPIMLANGTIGFAETNDVFHHLYWLYSTNKGITWHETSIGAYTANQNEASQIETKTNGQYNGGILILQRMEASSGTTLAKWRSNDYGATWRSDGMLTGLCKATASKVSLCRVNDNIILLTISDGGTMYMLYSTDEGATWLPNTCPGYKWNPGNRRGYPTTLQYNENLLLTIWCTNWTGGSDVFVTPTLISSLLGINVSTVSSGATGVTGVTGALPQRPQSVSVLPTQATTVSDFTTLPVLVYNAFPQFGNIIRNNRGTAGSDYDANAYMNDYTLLKNGATAWTFSDPSDYICIPTGPEIDRLHDMTLEFMVYIGTQTATGEARIFSKAQDYSAFELIYDDVNERLKITRGATDDDYSIDEWVSDEGSVPSNDWYYIQLLSAGSGPDLDPDAVPVTIMLDNVLLPLTHSQIGAGSWSADFFTDLYIGNNADLAGNANFVGVISLFRLYKELLADTGVGFISDGWRRDPAMATIMFDSFPPQPTMIPEGTEVEL